MADVVFDPKAARLTVRMRHSGLATIAWRCAHLDAEGNELQAFDGTATDSGDRDLSLPVPANHGSFIEVSFSYSGEPAASIGLTFDIDEWHGKIRTRLDGFDVQVPIVDSGAHAHQQPPYKLVGRGMV